MKRAGQRRSSLAQSRFLTAICPELLRPASGHCHFVRAFTRHPGETWEKRRDLEWHLFASQGEGRGPGFGQVDLIAPGFGRRPNRPFRGGGTGASISIFMV